RTGDEPAVWPRTQRPRRSDAAEVRHKRRRAAKGRRAADAGQTRSPDLLCDPRRQWHRLARRPRRLDYARDDAAVRAANRAHDRSRTDDRGPEAKRRAGLQDQLDSELILERSIP